MGAVDQSVAESVMAELRREKSYHHSEFANPQSESCWLSTFFQSLWHSRVFHATFERLVKPLPPADARSALRALQDTWELYKLAALKNTTVPITALVQAWGPGCGDCAEAFGKL